MSAAPAPAAARGATPRRWLFSAPLDLALFGGSAAVALALVALGPWLGPATAGRGGAVGSDAPEWSWIVGVLLVDVAHVWSTAFIVYLDPVERRRRPWRYALAPLASFTLGVALYAHGAATFWRALAYLAVFHFIRQQYGWVMMYRARGGELDRLGRWLDGATIYAATLYPLIVWHTRLPRSFWWMKEGDFAAGLPAATATAAGWLYAALAATYVGRAGLAAVRHRPAAWGKHLVVATTAACWYVGIVATDSDYAFTVTNVLIHGVPYLGLVYVYARAARAEVGAPRGLGAWLLGGGLGAFLATLWAIAYVEELIWDRAIWHERGYLFGLVGAAVDVGWLAGVIVPLLATPQLTHYALDGFLWRRGGNPRLGRLL